MLGYTHQTAMKLLTAWVWHLISSQNIFQICSYKIVFSHSLSQMNIYVNLGNARAQVSYLPVQLYVLVIIYHLYEHKNILIYTTVRQ